MYRIYGVAALAGLAWLGVALFVAAGAVLAAGGDVEDPAVSPGVALAVLIAYAGVGVLYVSVRTAFENLAWNHTQLDDASLREPAAHQPDAADLHHQHRADRDDASDSSCRGRGCGWRATAPTR